MQAHLEGKPALPLQIANAARGAITALDLAEAGVPGARGSIDGPFGYLPLFEDGFDLEPVLASLGKAFRIAEVSWKPFPTGRAAHGGLVAVQTLMQQGLTAATLRRLTYRAPPLIARLVGRPATPGMQAPYARLCLPYLVAVTLTRGTVGLEDFGPERLADPALLEIAARVVVENDGNADPAAFTPALATAQLADGGSLQTTVESLLGSPAQPLTREQHLDKARACLTFAGYEAAHDPLAAAMERFSEATDARDVITLITDGTRP
jgi:2-methylcitrate dehydratase PrpD